MLDLATSKKKSGWTTVAFGDVVQLSKERSSDPEGDGFDRYIGLEHIDPGELRVRRWGDVADGVTFTNVFCPGQVLFGKRRAYQRKVAVAEFSGVCSGDIYVLEPKGNALLPELLPFICQTDAFFDHAVGTSAGSLSPRTNWKSLADFEFALPPIEEQRRIADALVATQLTLNKLLVLGERASSTTRSLLDVRLRSFERSAPLIPVGDLLVDGPRNGLSPKANSQERGIRSVSLGAVSDGCFTPDGQVKYVDLTMDEASPYLVKQGDIFAVRGNGNRQLVARVGRSAQSYDDLIYPDLLIRMRFDPDQINHDFLVAQWNHPSVHARLLARAKSSNGIWKVNGQDIRAHELVVPHLAEQESIAEELGEFTTVITDAERRMTLLHRFKSGIMAAMMGGGNE